MCASAIRRCAVAYRVKHKDSDATASLRRIARDQVTAALRSIDHANDDTASAIHEVRRRCKKIRALLRLVRPSFDGYRDENAAFRDIAATLGPMRDADILIAAFDQVVGAAGAEGAGAPDPIRAQLHARREELEHEADSQALLQDAREALTAALQRIEHWQLSRKGFGAFEAGLESTYRRGRKAMRTACRNGEDAAFHAWRKRCKEHGFHLRLLRPIWPGPMRAEHDCASELGELLGLHHDFAVLASRLRAMPGIDPAMAEALSDRIATQQEELASRACSLGARLYALPPAALAKSWRRRHAAWRRDPDPC
ncbi:hypothetical protein CNR27_09000 [Luteimonas chenhongjianii]|uniref:CHAD domain-containing protein n=1 Tax=Luteimonas chenhongjianii TaxID=2006110 RepID=A0A290XEG2_9GAMM|nr:hypothetical protein CNR27_09000 [Luteimonas chenhongjianii]